MATKGPAWWDRLERRYLTVQEAQVAGLPLDPAAAG
jgi:hypothetical protein